jgi:hypothetical protein
MEQLPMEIVSLCFDPSGCVLFMASGPCLWAWAYSVPHSTPYQLLVQPPRLRCVACPVAGGRLITGSANVDTGPNARHGINGRLEATFRLVAWHVDFEDLARRLATGDEPALAIGAKPALLAPNAVLYNDGGVGFSPWGDRAVVVTYLHRQNDDQSDSSAVRSSEEHLSTHRSIDTDTATSPVLGTPTAGVSAQMESIALVSSPRPRIVGHSTIDVDGAQHAAGMVANTNAREVERRRPLTPNGSAVGGSSTNTNTMALAPPVLVRPSAGAARRQRDRVMTSFALGSLNSANIMNHTAPLDGGAMLANISTANVPGLVRPDPRLFGSSSSNNNNNNPLPDESPPPPARNQVNALASTAAIGDATDTRAQAQRATAGISTATSGEQNRLGQADSPPGGGYYSIDLLSLVEGNEGRVIKRIPLSSNMAKGVTSIKVGIAAFFLLGCRFSSMM